MIRASRDACSSESQAGTFDWSTLGSAAGACFRCVPDIGFLYELALHFGSEDCRAKNDLCAPLVMNRFGLMDTEVVHKERRRARRVQDDEEAKESQPSEYTNKVGRSIIWLSLESRPDIVLYWMVRITERPKRRSGASPGYTSEEDGGSAAAAAI